MDRSKGLVLILDVCSWITHFLVKQRALQGQRAKCKDKGFYVIK